jgi:hypothetical protein
VIEDFNLNLDSTQYLHKIETHVNELGSLGVLDFVHGNIPFTPLRIFYIYGVGESIVRGKHAHKKCKQFFVQLSGNCKITFVNKKGTGSYTLANPYEGFLASELTWCEISDFSADSVLLVLASLPYDIDDYIHDYAAFKAHAGILDDTNS